MDAEIFALDGDDDVPHDHFADALGFDPLLSSFETGSPSWLLGETLDLHETLPGDGGFTSFQDVVLQFYPEFGQMEPDHCHGMYLTAQEDILDVSHLKPPMGQSGCDTQSCTGHEIDTQTALASSSGLVTNQFGTMHQTDSGVLAPTIQPSTRHTFLESATACQLQEITKETTTVPASSIAKRIHIDAKARKILDMYFIMNAYPSNDIISALTIPTSLPEATIRTWFANTRSRRDVPSAIPEEISVANLDRLNRASPPPSNTSIDRYLTTSPEDEPLIPRISMLWALQSSSLIEIPSTKRSDSNAGSVDSVGSVSSFGSVRSTDSRGSRQGRPTWVKPKTKRQEDRTATLHRYFCTWPDCDRMFQHRYAWERHEEAIHYRPYRWVCCANQTQLQGPKDCGHCSKKNISLLHGADKYFESYAKRPEADRTFFRQDQLRPHIKRHLRSLATKDCVNISYLLKAWKSDNPTMEAYALRCGFCGASFPTWQDRTQHVFDHFLRTICKSSWWPDRLPIIDLQNTSTISFTCPNCSKDSGNLDEALENHRFCVVYSCRYLHGYRAITEHVEQKALSTCRLCFFRHMGGRQVEDVEYILKKYAETHSPRSCIQAIFTSKAEFIIHMEDKHKATWCDRPDLTSWKCSQALYRHKGQAVIRTAQRFREKTPLLYEKICT